MLNCIETSFIREMEEKVSFQEVKIFYQFEKIKVVKHDLIFEKESSNEKEMIL
jgi:hypothetical protein